MLKVKRKKKCKVCHEPFRPFLTTQVVCSTACALVLAKVVARKGKSQYEKMARAKHRADKERIKPRSKLRAEAQASFNKFIRLRDDGLPCISCGVMNPPERFGGAWDCGHYLSVGAHPELRFEELNAARQCKADNAGAGRFSAKNRTVQQVYRERLIVRIGLDKVLWLEGPHEAKHYSGDDFRAIKVEYRKKTRELKACRH